MSHIAVYIHAIVSYTEETRRGTVHLEKTRRREIRFDFVTLEREDKQGTKRRQFYRVTSSRQPLRAINTLPARNSRKTLST